jgi:hypothetical protein
MAFRICVWTDENEAHLAEHDVTPEEFEAVLDDPDEVTWSRSSGDPAVIGYIRGRRLFCVYREIDDVYVEPVTAYEIED